MAKTTGKISGNIRLLYMDNVLVGCATTNGLTVNNETVESTCKDGTNPPPRTYENGAQEWGFTAEIIVRFDDSNQYSRLAVAAKTGATHTWKFASVNADDPYWQGEGFVSAFGETAAINAPDTVSLTISPRAAIYFFNT